MLTNVPLEKKILIPSQADYQDPYRALKIIKRKTILCNREIIKRQKCEIGRY